MKFALRQFSLALFAVLLLVATGCSTIVTSSRQKLPMMEQFAAGDVAGALAFAQKKHVSAAGSVDELVWLLECGSLQFYLGQYEAALDSFRLCEALIEEYDERALVSLTDTSTEALAVLSNENALPYRGWCRDRVALGIFKSLAYLGVGKEEAFRAQVKRLRQEHQKIQEDYQKFFDKEQERVEEEKAKYREEASKASSSEYLNDPRNEAFAASVSEMQEVAHRGYGNFLNPVSMFLSALALMRDGSWDNARIEFERLYKALPNNQYVKQYYATALRRAGRPSPAALLDVQPFPFPLERNCVFVLFAHDMCASFDQMAVYFPLMIAWPVCVYHPAVMPSLTVQADGVDYPVLPLADMDGILSQEFGMRLPARIVRTVTYALIKEAGYIATMESMNRSMNDNANKGMAMFATAMAYKTYQAMFNTADTRGWFMLPKEFCVAQMPMPQDRTLNFSGLPSASAIQIPEGCGSAIVYVNAMTPAKIQYQVFPLK